MPCRQQGHAISSFTLDISVPGATLVRQQAVWHWLRKDDALARLCTGHSPGSSFVDIKEAVRLALLAPLAEQLHCPHSPGRAHSHDGPYNAPFCCSSYLGSRCP
jgi:hypothetical protein